MLDLSPSPLLHLELVLKEEQDETQHCTYLVKKKNQIQMVPWRYYKYTMIVAILALAEVKIIQNENREIQPFTTAEDPLQLHKIKVLAVKYLQNEDREIQPFTTAEEPLLQKIKGEQEILPFTTAEDRRQLQKINTMINVVNQVDTIGGNEFTPFLAYHLTWINDENNNATSST